MKYVLNKCLEYMKSYQKPFYNPFSSGSKNYIIYLFDKHRFFLRIVKLQYLFEKHNFKKNCYFQNAILNFQHVDDKVRHFRWTLWTWKIVLTSPCCQMLSMANLPILKVHFIISTIGGPINWDIFCGWEDKLSQVLVKCFHSLKGDWILTSNVN